MLEMFLSAIKCGSFLRGFILQLPALLSTHQLVMITMKDPARKPILIVLLILTIFLSAKYFWGSDTKTEELLSNTFNNVVVVLPSTVKRPPPGGEATCPAILEELHLYSDEHWAMGRVFAHGTHSLTLNTLRYFFDQTAPEQNGVPVVSPEMSGPAILDSAPFIKTDHTSVLNKILL